MTSGNNVLVGGMPHHILVICPVITPGSVCSSDGLEDDNTHKWDDDGAGDVLEMSPCNEVGISPGMKFKILKTGSL